MSGSDDKMSEAMRNLVRQDAQDRARENRQRTSAHQSLATEEATFDGALLDAKEAGVVVRIFTEGDRSHRGKITDLHSDYIGLAIEDRQGVFIARRAVRAFEIAVSPKRNSAPSDRLLQTNGPSFASRLSEAAEAMPDVKVFVTGAKESITGNLFSVNADMITLVRHHTTATVFVPLEEISEITLLG